jgi:hypothetical protein
LKYLNIPLQTKEPAKPNIEKTTQILFYRAIFMDDYVRSTYVFRIKAYEIKEMARW